MLNRFRRDNPAMQQFLNLRFLACRQRGYFVLCEDDGGSEPTSSSSSSISIRMPFMKAIVELPLGDFGMDADTEFSLDEAFTQRVVACRGTRLHVRLDPAEQSCNDLR